MLGNILKIAKAGVLAFSAKKIYELIQGKNKNLQKERNIRKIIAEKIQADTKHYLEQFKHFIIEEEYKAAIEKIME